RGVRKLADVRRKVVLRRKGLCTVILGDLIPMNTQIRARRRPRASVLALPLSCFAFLGIVPHAFGLPTAPVVAAHDKVAPAVSFKTVPFDLAEVRLLG